MSRSNFTIYDEVAIMKKSSIDQIFEGMLFPRQPDYINDSKYAGNPRWLEESKSIYLTSSKYKYLWWYKLWKDCVTGYYMDKTSKYNIFATDYFDNIENGLKTWGDFKRAKARMNEFDFRMELLNEAIGESEDSFFGIKEFKENQIIDKSFVPPKALDIIMDNDLGNRPKKSNEIRIVIADFAFANSISRHANDNTIIILMSLHRKKNKFERHVDYIEGWSGGDSTGAGKRVRELYFTYNADYIVPDMRNGGETLYNLWTEPWERDDWDKSWMPNGLTVVSPTSPLHVATRQKIDDLIARTVDPNAIPCIIPMQGSTTLNSQMWAELKKQLQINNIKFLISTEDKTNLLEDSGEYFQYTSEEYAEVVAPHTQTDLLVQEAVALKKEIKNGNIILSENSRGAFKDRIVCLSYGNYIASKIENEWNKNEQEEEFDTSSIQLVW